MSDRPGEAYIHRYNELVKKLLGAKGGEPMAELAAELLPVIILENDPLVYALYRGELLWWGIISQAASIGNLSHVGVQNPPGSGLVVTIEGFLCPFLQTAGNVALRINAPVTGTAVTAPTVQRDARAKGTPATLLARAAPAAAIGVQVGAINVPAAPASVVYPIGQVIGPNNEFWLEDPSVNDRIDGFFFGRERAVEASERF